MHFKPFFLFVIVLFGINSSGYSQTVKSENNAFWFHYLGKNNLTDKLSFTFEGTLRHANGFSEKQQWFVRPSFDYQFTKSFAGSLGYSHYNTYSYGSPAMNKTDIPEDHVWIQGVYVHNLDDFKFTHRLRNEHRFVGIAKYDVVSGQYDIDHYVYRNRLRYMFLVNYPFLKKADQIRLFGILGDEAFMNIGRSAGATFFNQNRIIGGLGYNINAHHQIQLAYIHQNIWNYSNTLQESNATVRISYLTNFKW